MSKFALTFHTPAPPDRAPIVRVKAPAPPAGDASPAIPDPVAKSAVLKVAKKAIWEMSDDEYEEQREDGGGSLEDYLAYIDGVHEQDREIAIAEAKPAGDPYHDQDPNYPPPDSEVLEEELSKFQKASGDSKSAFPGADDAARELRES